MRLVPLTDDLVTPLSEMLRGVEATFRPFDFTPAAIRQAVKEGDEPGAITPSAGDVPAYGLLRGWADGWRVPAIGVAVTPAYRRQGLATAMMLFLHYRAGERGASHVMLHVDDENEPAKSLYMALGYRPAGDRWELVL